MSDKYISFSPYFSGLSNVIMSYELAFSIAHITKRKIIIPPKTWILFISKSDNLEDFSNIWEIFDKDYIKSEFDCIDFYDVPEFQNIFNQIKGPRSFTANLTKYVFDIASIQFPKGFSITDNHTVLKSGTISNEDFEKFSENREVINLDRPEKYLHFEGNLFGSFWYHIYPGDIQKRNELKQKINRCFKYQDRFYEIAEKVKKKLGEYNAIHVRRNDFFIQYSENLKSVDGPYKLLDRVSNLLSTSIPLYISTDETNMDFFDAIREKYQIYFYDDFDFDLSSLDKVVLEQVICSNANEFYGTIPSTYTKRINVMRGCNDKQSYDWMGINFSPTLEQLKEVSIESALPWTLKYDRLWPWNYPYHPQWIMET